MVSLALSSFIRTFFLSFFLISILNFAYYSEANFILFCCWWEWKERKHWRWIHWHWIISAVGIFLGFWVGKDQVQTRNNKRKRVGKGGGGKKKKKLPFSDTPFLPPFLGGGGLYFNSYYYNCELVTNFHFCPWQERSPKNYNSGAIKSAIVGKAALGLLWWNC